MNNFDSNGWDNIHSVAFKGFISSLEKLIEKYPEKLELATTDELRSTPLLLAAMSGNLNTVQELIKLGAQVHTRNSQGHGIIEIICLRKDIKMLTYFLDNFDEDVLPVWVHLVNFMSSFDDEESIRASYCINQILINNKSKEMRLPYEEKCIAANIIQTIIKVVKGLQGYECKRHSLMVLLHIIIYQEVRETFINNGGLEVVLPLLRPPSNPDLAKIVIQILDVLISEPNGFSEKVFHSGAINDMNKIIEWSALSVEEKYGKYDINYKDFEETLDDDNESLKHPHLLWYKLNLVKEIVHLLGNLAEIHSAYQNTIGKEPGFLKRIGILFRENENRSLLIELTKFVTKLATNNSVNQNTFMKENIEDSLINLSRTKDQTIRLAAVDAIISLADDNKDYQDQLKFKCAHKPLLVMLRKSGRNIMINEKAASALWSLAGHKFESKADMANLIGVNLLINFLQTSSSILQLIGSEAIYILSGGPLSQRDIIGKQNGIQLLVNLLKSNNIQIVLNCIRSIRQLCVKIGYVPHPWNQQLVILTRGLQVLVSLMRFSDDEIVQAEAAYTIAAVAMHNEEASAQLHSNSKFNYVYILEKMYSSFSKVQLLAGASLAAFAYNNIAEQKKIAMYGGIRFKCLHQLLFEGDEYERCMSAFQLVVLARVIPDEELAISIACGIKSLIQILVASKIPDVQELGCDCVARLCNHKAGIVHAMVSYGIVDILCTLMISYTDSVKGSAAIAVECLSHYPEARRQVLRKCRRDPYLMKVIMFYNKEKKIDSDFIDGWNHYKKVGLPKIDTSRPFLTSKKEIDIFKDLNEKQIILFSSSSEHSKISSFTDRQIRKRFPPFKTKSPVIQAVISENKEILSQNSDMELNSEIDETNEQSIS